MTDNFRNKKKLYFSTQLVEKYSLDPIGSGFMVFLPGFQPAGHTSPCLSVNWNAWTNLKASSTDLKANNNYDFYLFFFLCYSLQDYSPTNRQIINSDLSEILLIIDYEKSTEWNPSFLIEHTVVSGNFAALVSQQWNVHISKATLLTWCINPCQVAEVWVTGCGD